jgi:hypothetical protein
MTRADVEDRIGVGRFLEELRASLTDGSYRPQPVRERSIPKPTGGPIVTEVNQALRHWGAYFRVGTSTRKFYQVDEYVRERLALFLSKKTGRRGPH